MRGKTVAARSPASSASRFDATGMDSTRTGAPNASATSAVSSVQPLATTITSSPLCPGPAVGWPSSRPITRDSS
jgi:hypothetical protein